MERFLHANEETALNPDPFDLVKRDFVAGAVVELGCARGLVRGHGLGILEGAAGLDRASGKAIQSAPKPRALGSARGEPAHPL